jgi:formate dehydrogenase subunit gamma
MSEYDPQPVSQVIEQYEARPEMLVQILHAVVDRLGYVPEQAIRQLADELNLSRADVHGVVSYYHDFRTEPPGRHIVKICQAEACQAMGSRELVAHAESSSGSDVTLEPVYCLGNCACAPSIMVDGKTIGRVDSKRFDRVLARLGGAA